MSVTAAFLHLALLPWRPMRAGFITGAAFVLGVIAGVLLAPFVTPQPQPHAQPQAQHVPPKPPPPADAFTAARLRADEAMDGGHCEQAVAAYESALSIRFDPDVATDRGVCLRQLGKRDEALAAFEFVTLKDPSHWKARYNLTAMLLEAGHVAEAKTSFAILETLRADDEAVRTLSKALAAAH